VSVTRTRYYCPVEVAVEVLGGRWTPVILAHLKEGVHRYGELRRKMPDISEKMLSQRLRELERAGLVERTAVAGSVLSVSYGLTDQGCELKPVLEALYRWGEHRAAIAGIPIEPVRPGE
jgi:DNA-binding HxlR family transcriptional regulator